MLNGKPITLSLTLLLLWCSEATQCNAQSSLAHVADAPTTFTLVYDVSYKPSTNVNAVLRREFNYFRAVHTHAQAGTPAFDSSQQAMSIIESEMSAKSSTTDTHGRITISSEGGKVAYLEQNEWKPNANADSVSIISADETFEKRNEDAIIYPYTRFSDAARFPLLGVNLPHLPCLSNITNVVTGSKGEMSCQCNVLSPDSYQASSLELPSYAGRAQFRVVNGCIQLVAVDEFVLSGIPHSMWNYQKFTTGAMCPVPSQFTCSEFLNSSYNSGNSSSTSIPIIGTWTFSLRKYSPTAVPERYFDYVTWLNKGTILSDVRKQPYSAIEYNPAIKTTDELDSALERDRLSREAHVASTSGQMIGASSRAGVVLLALVIFAGVLLWIRKHPA